MSQPIDIAHAVLSRVGQFVRRLSQDDVAALADGTARLDLVRPADPTPSAPTPSAPTPSAPTPSAPANVLAKPGVAEGSGLPVEPEVVRAALAQQSDRAAAAAYLDKLGLTAPQLRNLAKALGLAVSAKAPKAEVRDTIVQWTVGRRVDAAVLSRPAPPRP